MNKTIKTVILNGEIPVDKLRGDDEKCTELDLSHKNYQDADVIIISALLVVSPLAICSVTAASR